MRLDFGNFAIWKIKEIVSMIICIHVLQWRWCIVSIYHFKIRSRTDWTDFSILSIENFTSLRDETKDEKLKRKERKMTDVISIKSQFKSARAK